MPRPSQLDGYVGRSMGRLCERPGCSDVAAMAFGFDVDRLLVWLSPHDPDGDPLRAGSLCERHADAMVVPRGWTLDDRRESPRLFRPDAVTAPGPGRSPPRHRTAPAEPAPQLALGDDPDATVAIPWMPDFDERDDLDGVLAAQSPLLARAFRGTDRRR